MGRRVCLTRILTLCSLASAWAAGQPVAELAAVRTTSALEAATPHRLTNGWVVRLGVGEPGKLAAPWKLLYSPGMIRQLPKTRARGRELPRAMTALRGDVATMALLSNRLDLTLTEPALEIARRRGARWETDF